MISWAKPQVQARSHPNVLAATAWLNNLYHVRVADIGNSEKDQQLANTLKGVDLNIPLTYADRFRIRKPGFTWNFHPPHVDGAYHTFAYQFIPILIQDARRGIDREMGGHDLQDMFRRYFEWQLERP